MERIIEKKQNGLITKIVTDNPTLPTTADTYAFNCHLYTEQTIGETKWINSFVNINSSGAPNWCFNGRGEYEEMADGYVSKAKVNYVTLPVIVAPTATTGESDPDETIVNGEILGYYPTGNQDAFVTNVEITVDAKVKITLASAATAPNTFNVVILKN